MSTRAAALLWVVLALAVGACESPRSATPVPGERRILIGTPPVLLLGQVEPVPSGNAARQQRMLALFREVGCKSLEQRWRSGSELPHVRCILPGESDAQIVVSANFDQPLAETQRDNWAGAAMLPSLYLSLAVAPRRHTYVFVGFADESHGRPGSPAASARMVSQLPEEERRAIAALVGLQGLELHMPGFWESEADPNLRLDLTSVSHSLELPVRPINFHFVRKTTAGGGRFDVPMLLRDPVRMPALDVPSILIGVADLQEGEYLDSFRLVAAYLSYLDQTLQVRREMREQKSGPAASPAPG